MAIIEAPFALAIHENPSIRGLIQSILKHAGYRVLAVATENEAMRLLRAGCAGIRLLILDQCANGLARMAGPQCEGVKVLYLTPFRSLAERVADAMKHPESGFLAKPFSPKALLNLVDALIGPPANPQTDYYGSPAGEDESFFSASRRASWG